MTKFQFVIHRFKTGGVERVFLNIAEQLADHEVSLIIIENDYDSVYCEIPVNVNVIDFNHIRSVKLLREIKDRLYFLSHLIRVLLFVVIIVKARRHLREENSIVINFSDTLSTLLFSLSLKGKKISWVHSNPRVIKKSAFGKLYSYLYRKFDSVICICKSQKELFLRLFKFIEPSKVKVVYNAIDIEKIEEKCVSQLTLNQMDFLLMVSRLDTRSKDFFSVIQAYHLLNKKQSLKLPKMYILGEGPDRTLIQQEINRLELTDKVILWGNDPNPYRWMKKAKAFIFSSKAEGFGLVLLEAMYCQVPIISTDCEVGPKEILEDGKHGKLVEIGDVEGFKKAIEEALVCKRNSISIVGAKEKALYFSTSNRDLLKEIL